MSVYPCSCFFEDDFEQICIVEIEILCVKSLVFNASNDVKFYDFDTCQYFFFFVILENILSLIAIQECYIRESFSKSSQICGLTKTRELNFIVIVNICGKFLSSPVLYTNSKYISYVWTVLCLCIPTSSNISEIYMTAYFQYFNGILHVLHIQFPCTFYHLTW